MTDYMDPSIEAAAQAAYQHAVMPPRLSTIKVLREVRLPHPALSGVGISLRRRDVNLLSRRPLRTFQQLTKNMQRRVSSSKHSLELPLSLYHLRASVPESISPIVRIAPLFAAT
jgi:hypothetical protein